MLKATKYFALIAVIVLASAWTVTHGQSYTPGSLDPTFGSAGVASMSLDPNLVERLTTQMVGTEEMIIASTGLNRQWTIARHRANGALDTSFAYNAKSRTGGVIRNPFTKSAWVGQVVVQPQPDGDGKLVVAGTAQGVKSGQSIVVIRYTANGQKDLSFGSNGLVTVPVPGAPVAQGLAAVLQADGQVVVVGRACDLTDSMYCGSVNHPWSLVAVRLSSDGTIDKEFGNFGVFSYRHPTSLNASNGFPAVAIQDLAVPGGPPDPRIVITTTAWGGGAAGVAVVLRLISNGTLDPDFGEGGWTQLALSGADEAAVSHVAIDSECRIVATGSAYYSSGGVYTNNLLVVRFDKFGRLDPAFNNGLGYWSERWQNGNAGSWSSAIQPDDSILVAGYAPSNSPAAVWRFLPSGVPDEHFGSEGWVTLPSAQFADICLVHKADGTSAFVVGGRRSVQKGNSTTFYWALWRYFY